jgi:hypothetical protein
MSQHDFEITTADANTGFDMRAAINAALQALASSSGASTAPTTAYPNQFWADRVAGYMKIRSSTNATWVKLYSLATGWSDFFRTLVSTASAASFVQNIGIASAFHPAGSVNCSGNPNYSASDAGDVYLVAVAGRIGGAAGPKVEAGDEIYCWTTNGGGTHAAVGANFSILQNNLDLVTATSATLGIFKIIVDGTFASNSDNYVPTQKAVKTYADTKIAASRLDTDGTFASNSDTKVASQKAAKTYSDTKIASSRLDTDGTFASNSDTKVASQKATKTYADTKIASSRLDTSGTLASNSDTKVASQKATKTYADTKVAKTDYNAQSMMASVATNSPVSVVITEQSVVGRLTGGNIKPLSVTELTSLLNAATSATRGAIKTALAALLNSGTNATTAVTPKSLSGSIFGQVVIGCEITQTTALTTGNGKAHFRIPAKCNGMNIVGVAASCATNSSSGKPTFRLRNATDGVDVLSTKLTVDVGETDSATAATAAVIDTTKDDVATGDQFYWDCDLAGTGTKWVYLEATLQLP